MKQSAFLRSPLLALCIIATPCFSAPQAGCASVILDKAVLAGLDNDLEVWKVLKEGVDVVRNAPQISSYPFKEWDRRYYRLKIAIRVAAERNLVETRWDLLKLAEECNERRWADLAIQVYGALKALGEPRSYFIRQFETFPERPYCAVGAIRVVTSFLEPDTSQILDQAILTVENSSLDKKNSVVSQLRKASFQYSAYERTQREVRRLREKGDQLSADKYLIASAYLPRHSTDPNQGLDFAYRVFGPRAVYTHLALSQRLQEGRDALVLALESMTWHDLTRERTSSPMPLNAEEIVLNWKARIQATFFCGTRGNIGLFVPCELKPESLSKPEAPGPGLPNRGSR